MAMCSHSKLSLYVVSPDWRVGPSGYARPQKTCKGVLKGTQHLLLHLCEVCLEKQLHQLVLLVQALLAC